MKACVRVGEKGFGDVTGALGFYMGEAPRPTLGRMNNSPSHMSTPDELGGVPCVILRSRGRVGTE